MVLQKTQISRIFSLEWFNMTAQRVICQALAEGKSDEDIYTLLQASHPENAAARNFKSCRQQVSWYRSQMKRGFYSTSGDRLDRERSEHTANRRRTAEAVDPV